MLELVGDRVADHREVGLVGVEDVADQRPVAGLPVQALLDVGLLADDARLEDREVAGLRAGGRSIEAELNPTLAETARGAASVQPAEDAALRILSVVVPGDDVTRVASRRHSRVCLRSGGEPVDPKRVACVAGVQVERPAEDAVAGSILALALPGDTEPADLGSDRRVTLVAGGEGVYLELGAEGGSRGEVPLAEDTGGNRRGPLRPRAQRTTRRPAPWPPPDGPENLWCRC